MIMSEPIASSIDPAFAESELREAGKGPRGVLPKNLKPALYLGAAGLVIAAALFSATGKKPGTKQGTASQQTPQPLIQDNTDNNAQELRTSTAAAEQKMAQQGGAADPQLQGPTAAQQAAAAAYGPNGQATPCVPGQPCVPQQEQLSPAAQEEQQLAARDRQLAYDSRFASNLVYTRTQDQPSQKSSSLALADNSGAMMPQQGVAPAQSWPDQSASSLIQARAAGEPQAPPSAQTAAQAPVQRKAEVNIDSATGQPYVLYEGTTLDTVLMNRLDGDAAGPVKVLVSNPVYSHDRQHVLIPEGTIVLGEARKIGATGFGQQRRMAIVFHRMIMPDGYSVDLDQFQGLNQTGEEGLKDKVNNHYLQIFGTSIALGVIAGAGQIEEGGGMITTSGSQAFVTGASANISESAMTVLDRFIQIPPTITIREGHRVKVYFMQDMLLPAYENHTIPQTF
jgi:type IV secretory pathway VirB10-like protein